MNAIWHVHQIAEMDAEANLRNTCRQIEQKYVDWGHTSTYGGFAISQQWPTIGELGRYLVSGCILSFVTTRKRTILIRLPDGKNIAEVKIAPGMASELYLEAGRILDLNETRA